jgi:hypothetical protein
MKKWQQRRTFLTGRLRGLHKEVWENMDTEKFLKKERQFRDRQNK